MLYSYSKDKKEGFISQVIWSKIYNIPVSGSKPYRNI